MGGTIVCGVTEAGEERCAGELAFALGARLGLRVVLVAVVDGVPRGAEESVSGRQRVLGAERQLAQLARELGDGAETRVLQGARAETLAQAAAEEGADVIVLGSRPAGLGGRNLRCTLARELEAATPVPVVVAPPATRQRSERRLDAGGRRDAKVEAAR
jgi:nucleotide-binding universal stress UspA family protein